MTVQLELIPIPQPSGPGEAWILQNPLSSPLWSQIETCLFETMTSDLDITMSELKEMIREERFGVLVVMGGDLVNGVILLDADHRWVELSFVWSEGLGTLNRLLDGAEAIARATGMHGVKWVTSDERGQQYAKRRGYRKRLVEYVKEVT